MLYDATSRFTQKLICPKQYIKRIHNSSSGGVLLQRSYVVRSDIALEDGPTCSTIFRLSRLCFVDCL